MSKKLGLHGDRVQGLGSVLGPVDLYHDLF